MPRHYVRLRIHPRWIFSNRGASVLDASHGWLEGKKIDLERQHVVPGRVQCQFSGNWCLVPGPVEPLGSEGNDVDSRLVGSEVVREARGGAFERPALAVGGNALQRTLPGE
jgi:hypothetical protein